MVWKSVLGITLSMLLMLKLATTAATPVVMSGCPDRCGDISIPYPFGTRQGCYMNEWFEIECNETTNTSPRAFIRRINMEVLNISFATATATVKTPVISSNCTTGREVGKPVDLTGTPFVFSGHQNIFVAAGCNTRALMTGTGSRLIGCESTCGNLQSTDADGMCASGKNCCLTNIPKFLQVFHPRLESIDDDDQGCKLGFIASSTWFLSNVSDEPVSLQYRDYVLTELAWLMNLNDRNSQSRKRINCRSDLYNQSYQTECFCNGGLEGNPYIEHGCTDIDECKTQEQRCQGILKCVNTWGSYKCEVNKFYMAIIIIGAVIIALSLLAGIWLLYRVIKKRKNIELKKKFFKRNGGLLLQQQLSSSNGSIEKTKVYSSKELEEATDRFNKNRILGKGGQGTVYKGMLTDGRIVAVKKSTIVDEEKLEEFINEVVILSQINHRNVVKLLGCCLETEVPLLVYEFVPNGNLFEYIHDENEEFSLSWEMRLQIAIEIAGALSYLHSAAAIPIYHRDIKSTNILLDEKYRAKVSDFGSSRSIAIDQTHLTTHVQGTFGYLDPEYFQSSQFTGKSDVYSFGVVLVELLSGQKPIFSTTPTESRSLATHFILLMKDDKLFEILDARVKQVCQNEAVVAVANLAKRCLNLNGIYRPTMKEVATELERIGLSLAKPNVRGNTLNNIVEATNVWDADPSLDIDDDFARSGAPLSDDESNSS